MTGPESTHSTNTHPGEAKQTFRETVLAKYGKDHFTRIGSKGGQTLHKQSLERYQIDATRIIPDLGHLVSQ